METYIHIPAQVAAALGYLTLVVAALLLIGLNNPDTLIRATGGWEVFGRTIMLVAGLALAFLLLATCARSA